MTELSIDNHKLMYHPERVGEWKEKGDCYPLYVEIGPTNNCNHHCVFCALDWIENGKDFIDTEVMVRSLEEMATLGVKSVMFAGEGEPLLHKNIGTFARTAHDAGIDVSITTNGIPLTQKKIEQTFPHLSWIRFSIDSGSPENYGVVHGTNPRDFEKLMSNLQKAVDYKKENNLPLTLGAQFLMIPQSMGEATRLASRLKEIGVDNLQIKPYSHHPQSKNNLVVDPKMYNGLEVELSRFNSKDFQVFFRRATVERICEGASYETCHGSAFMALIDSRGNVMPCNLFYGNNEMNYGNIYQQSFREIWEGERRKQVLNKLKNDGVGGCRKGCRLDTINRYLDRIKNPGPHDNFI